MKWLLNMASDWWCPARTSRKLGIVNSDDITEMMRKHRIPKGSDDPEAITLGAEPLHHIEPIDDLMDWNIGQDDPHDHYPWKWASYLEADGGPELGSISTPNGRRPDGTMHTYWSIAHNVWEPTGRLVCRVVNLWAHEQFGTPIPPEDAIRPYPQASDTP